MPAKRVKDKSSHKAKIKTKAQVKVLRDREQELIELGYKTAVSLLAEITVPAGVSPPRTPIALDKVIEHPRFFESKTAGITNYFTKNALFKEMGSDINSAKIFCYISLETNIRKAFDIDHGCPRDYFVRKQELLLEYLNQHPDFARGFLGENRANPNEHQKKMSQYFIRDITTRKIQPTKWLCDAFYNSISNLTFLLHYVNREKREMLPSLWFEAQDFTEDFKQSLLKNGGVSEGVIMQGIIRGDKDKMEQFDLYDARAKSSITIYLHQGDYQGLGDYIRKWFGANKRKIITAADKIYGFKTQLDSMLRDEMDDKRGVPGIKLEKVLLMINEVFEAAQIRKALGLGGSSSSDSSLGREERIKSARESVLEAFNYMNKIKEVKKLIAGSIAGEYADTYNSEFYKIFRQKGFARLPDEALADAYNRVKERFSDTNPERPRDWHEADFMAFVDKLIDEVDPVKQAIRRAEAAERKANDERAQRETAEKENIMLRALLAKYGQPLPLEAPDAKAEAAASKLVTRRRPLTRLFAAQTTTKPSIPVRRSRSIKSEQQTMSHGERPAKFRRT